MESIEYYRDFCIACLDDSINDLLRHSHLPPYNSDKCKIQEWVDHYESLKKKVKDFYDVGNFKMLKSWYKAFLEEMPYANMNFISANRQYFLDTYGFDLLDLDKKRRDKISKIVDSGKIKTDSQYRLLSEFVDELCQIDGDKAQIDKINALLIDYHQRVAARMKKCKTKK